ncbi:UDP-N-acetylglucosamine/UDP-glucose/GDP-mannose transporter isoform X3 [Catharus ustulatus]|uniref:UDP-N-acetylglucosamine/UDP-glucose/GDP-mannose transporter isoform X3 n=1 Tax=Catharus ustulatus TaxID=91951 RepID=UPI00140DA05D|nr:UDP-N-acetylglucosamine/UDP-glucose/GDP-mannose transporter isoform X3 [Catharus ustulatus]
MSAGQAAGEEADAAAATPALPRVLSALFYGASSFLTVLVNKALLSAYSFPSPMFLGIGQMAATILILYVSKLNKIVHFPDFDKSIPVKLFPLPLIYVGNHLSGLSSTSKLSLPMFTVLRKFTIPLTLLLEIIILGKRYPLNIIVSVFTIILGAFIAAGSDLSFNLEGYIYVLLNDIFTAANGVYTKQKIDPKELGKYGVLFYNACFMVIPTVIFSFSTGDFQQVSLDVFYCPVQSLQFCAHNNSSWCHQEYIHCLHWNVDWWRLHILHVELCRAKYLMDAGHAIKAAPVAASFKEASSAQLENHRTSSSPSSSQESEQLHQEREKHCLELLRHAVNVGHLEKKYTGWKCIGCGLQIHRRT